MFSHHFEEGEDPGVKEGQLAFGLERASALTDAEVIQVVQSLRAFNHELLIQLLEGIKEKNFPIFKRIVNSTEFKQLVEEGLNLLPKETLLGISRDIAQKDSDDLEDGNTDGGGI